MSNGAQLPVHPAFESSVHGSELGSAYGAGDLLILISVSWITDRPPLIEHPKFEPPIHGLEFSPASASGARMTPAEERAVKSVRAKAKSWVERIVVQGDGRMDVSEV